MTPEEFKTALAAFEIHLSEQQMNQFEEYYQFLVETNEKVNLTAITAKKEVYLKHFYDSLVPLLEVPTLRNKPFWVCDVGAGAGFPSIPMKIVCPQLKITIVDSLNKRIKFLQELVAKLGLEDVELCHARAEEFASSKNGRREQYDFVTARAVARMAVLSELCLPLVKVGGYFMALKAQKAGQEIEDAQRAIQILGGQLEQDLATTLPVTHDERHLLMIKKVKPTPKKYPRKAGTPARNPIR